MLSIGINSIATLNVHGIDCHYIINRMMKNKAKTLYKIAYLSESSGSL